MESSQGSALAAGDVEKGDSARSEEGQGGEEDGVCSDKELDELLNCELINADVTRQSTCIYSRIVEKRRLAKSYFIQCMCL